ncbi:nitrite reductase large subunit NirB [Acidiferrimicrobium sp. IK]|uniref:nitrite reductase large subunit NirB n=1 Tax=Acidiferrimicrobium sp. IK TaxID=2871700 RepID=UPI0021CB8DBC|nr:nitrite reductase large subunit NirB [Acidiferrimicrobium sp. IK]MCU4185270.1 nitrite reductase large subunit NirB [Acidiferrimicrobium sp. IK]
MSGPGTPAERPVILVVGHGMVGNKLVEVLVRRGATRSRDIVVVGEEREGGYDRVHLSALFDGGTPDDLSMIDPDVAADPAVRIVTGERVTHLDLAGQVALTDAGRTIRYEHAVLATGSYPFVPPVPGRATPGCFVYRTIDDVDAIKSWAHGRAHGVVVGGGLLGLEAAGALRSCGLATEVVEFAPRLMPAQVDPVGGELLGQRIRGLGLAVHTSTTVRRVVAGADGSVAAVELSPAGADPGDPADALATEMVVFAAGIRPRDDLARACGLEVGERGGVVVDAQCRSSDPHVFAIGECALAGGRVHGLVAPGYQMARVVADTICGVRAAFEATDTPTKLKLLGVDVASFGDAHGAGPGTSTVTLTDAARMVHKRLVVDAAGAVVGGVLVGDASAFDTLAAIAAGDADSPDDPASLLAPAGPADADPAGRGIAALKDTATICSCENVAKGAIRAAAAESIAERGSADVAGIKKATGAGTGCGGCAPQLSELVRLALNDNGIEMTRSLCEHFAYSRQDIVDLVRVGGIRSFSELLSKHGTGAGCEICKPTVASILASLQGAYILDGELGALQDSNDHFLANLQKDGTYSVVPRVPGGEITPDKLIVLGQVAQEFGLYVKLTGGQRVDLLGARIDQLPDIWARLVDAGFESGHAYGKAVRTVKSCVGTSWCRYGVGDSTRLAVDLELRYRGLRSPHKIKMAVSGCARECAEAQSKDVGVIATERGWNLYVCGNGGTRPRHADLLAEDLDTETLVRTIDRFVMFYVRSADRLQRTASWLDAMDGGIDHLRRVVVDDALGLGAELEADMARHVAGYRDEWAETLADPSRLRKFRTFVNTDRPDPNIVMVSERGQPRPAQPREKAPHREPAQHREPTERWQKVELAGSRR